ncbi:hypothetical protein F2P45_34450, partial [Massilia sp. CCM 8733]|nr:hypothetical protein [Massilia mucilaginosa]
MDQLIRKTLIASASALLACSAATPAFAADWPSGYTKCAAERETCVVGAAKRSVSYGASNKWVTKSLSGNVACNNATFGDPIAGKKKYCAIGPVTPTPTPPPTPTPTP